MSITLYDLSVPTFLQTTRALSGVLRRAAKHCVETGADPDHFVQARLDDDMAPFSFQIEAAWHHSVWGIEALKTGAFAPPPLVWPKTFAALQDMISSAMNGSFQKSRNRFSSSRHQPFVAAALAIARGRTFAD